MPHVPLPPVGSSALKHLKLGPTMCLGLQVHGVPKFRIPHLNFKFNFDDVDECRAGVEGGRELARHELAKLGQDLAASTSTGLDFRSANCRLSAGTDSDIRGASFIVKIFTYGVLAMGPLDGNDWSSLASSKLFRRAQTIITNSVETPTMNRHASRQLGVFNRTLCMALITMFSEAAVAWRRSSRLVVFVPIKLRRYLRLVCFRAKRIAAAFDI
ncbi:hypothetical protein B0H17DRAFT_1141706 [Mycena rosella]|uniref:Uncharacterized protein n=1 Tax=Mycena rosella TaxID=1033263 RepID=A0AAD7CZ83_MYCRO|nr:hypothetical protein B0H17DRAFT_1141706 [Mycena rosella]